MIRRNFLHGWALFVIGILCVALMPLRTYAASGYIQHNLVSDVPLLADFTDPNLVNPWGISFTASSPFWLCDQRTGLSTIYSTAGGVFAVSATVVKVPAAGGKTTPGPCTGTVVNTSGSAAAPVFSPGAIRLRTRGFGGCNSAMAVPAASPLRFTSPPEFPSRDPAFKAMVSSPLSPRRLRRLYRLTELLTAPALRAVAPPAPARPFSGPT